LSHVGIIGAGPAGIEAALYARALGHDVTVYEKEEPGAHVKRWGFVRLFSPWRLHTSPLGRACLAEQGIAPLDPEECPTGAELVRRYIEPLARSLGASVRSGVEVRAVAKRGLLKGDNIGGKLRARSPFRLLLRSGAGEDEEHADIVIDATGVLGDPCWLGDGGIPALGEEAAGASIRRHIPDVLGADRPDLEGKTVLVVGCGHSAATAVLDLIELVEKSPGTRAVWARRRSGPDPLAVYRPDPLPGRSILGEAANRAAGDPPEGLTVLSGVTVSRIAPEGDRLRVGFRPVDGGATAEEVVADRILSLVGYRPSSAIHRELQVHRCYASEGPMNLAAALLGRGGALDCLASVPSGPDVIRNPEPRFFIIGHKSYGRRSDFLLRAAQDQIRDVFRIVEDDPDLDLNAAAASKAGT